MLANRLNWRAERFDKIPASQFGFRNKKSCADNVSILHSEISNGSENSKATAALFLDIQGAYDNVLCDFLVHRLKQLSIPPLILQFMFNLINKRIVNVNFGSFNEVLTIYKGLPQGCVLSPILYSLYVSKLDHSIKLIPFVNILQFADDVCIFSKSLDVDTALDYLEEEANHAANWFDSVGLSLAPQKSTLCVFSKNIKIRNSLYSISIQKSLIHTQKSVKFLGILFQNDLRWNAHVQSVKGSCQNALKIIQYLRNT
ncbi:hypothetical protein PUN28_011868 [Cardiocondyla obscurior]|uniref:Reverse transcriptase domain-containing protein n=1 Tax=Cardiocondyla obscurior TaxID=286306 RepID=A0AAW2FG65_9HYME